MASEIDTPSKRSRLAARKNPYWQGVSGGRGGVSLGYRKGVKGPRSWVAKIVIEGDRLEERLGLADDDKAPAGSLGYKAAVVAALEWSRQQHSALEAQREAGTLRTGPMVRSAVEEYVKDRKKRSAPGGANTEGRLKRHVLSDKTFADTPLSKLRAPMIEDWRGRLPPQRVKLGQDEAAPVKARKTKPASDLKPVAPTTVNRVLNDLRAALNAAAQKHRRELPSSLPLEIKVGTKATRAASVSRKQILTDDEVRRIVDAAFDIDPHEDFGRLVMLAAATGARFSQLTAITVADVQPARGRVMVPGSGKGHTKRIKAPVAVPLSADVLQKLTPILAGRSGDEPLLLRWRYRSVGVCKWEKDRRSPWGQAFEVVEYWEPTIERAGVAPDTIMYALRHSSIVRGLRAGLPVRLVAALHDTSSDMIETHYSAYIIDATEELARRAALSFIPKIVSAA